MKRFLKIISSIFRSFYGFLALILTLCILVIVGAQGFIFWLNTDKGGQWLSAKINTQLEQAGYQLALENFSLSGVMGLKAGKLELLQSDTALILGEGLSFSVNPLPLGLNTLDINFKAKKIEVLALPQSENGGDEKSEPIENLPDLYFIKANIKIDIAQLSLSENIIDSGFETGLKIQQSIGLRAESVSSKGSIQLSNIKHNKAQYLPRNIAHTLAFRLEDQKITIENLSVENNNYQIQINGFYALANGAFDTKIKGQWLNAKQLTPELKNPIQLKAGFTGHVDDFTGEIHTKTTYKDIETTLESIVERKQNLITAKDIKGRGGPLVLNGAVHYNLESTFATGQIETALSDLQFFNNFIPDLNLSGSMKASAEIQEKGGKQAASFSADLQNMNYGDITAQKIIAKADMSDVRNVHSLKADVKLSKGRVADIDIETVDLNAATNQNGYDLTLSGNGYSINPFSLQAAALIKQPEPLNIDISKAELKTAQGAITAKGDITTERLNIQVAGNSLMLQQMAFVDLSFLPVELQALKVDITGSMEKPSINASYAFRPTIEEQYAASFEGKSTITSGTLTNEVIGKGKGVDSLSVNLNMPLFLSFQPFKAEIANDAALSGGASIQSDLQTIFPLFLDDGYIVTGQFTADSSISGTIKNPLLNGSAKLQDAAFVDTYNDIQLNDITGTILFKDRQIEITSLSAKDGDRKGAVDIRGKFDLQNISSPDIQASLKMTGMHLLKNKNYDAWLNADMRFDTNPNGYLISGTLSPEEVSIRIPDQLAATIPELNIVEAEGQKKPTDSLFAKTKLDIKFKADNKIFVSGRGLDAELQGNLDIKGNLKTPLVDGSLQTLRGRYEEFGRRFDLDKAVLRFQGAVPPSPYLDIETSTKVEGITAKVLITDTVEDPQIKLAAVPSLPEDEILSLILFGRDIQKISPFQAIQLANTLRKFSGKGGGGFDPLQQVKSATGLDDIRIDGAGTDGASVGAGKYISDKVYLEVEQGTADASSAASVEVEVTPNITVESKAAQNGESNVGVFWEWDY